MHRLLYLAFALSGGAGLVYEAVWGRYLALFVGHAAYAQVLVIGTYLGGMAIGALLVGERAKRIRSPLLWYARVELGLAVAGFLFHPIFRGATELAYEWMIPALREPALVGLAKWCLAVSLLFPQAILLGTTFPLMSSGVIRLLKRAPGRTLSLLYFTNSLGGAVGVLVGGFLLVGAFGLPGSLMTAGVLNLLAASVAFGVHRVQGTSRATAEVETEPAGMGVAPGGAGRGEAERGEAEAGSPLRRLLLGVSFLTAVASFAYEIGWIRMLSLVMGSATHSFEVMLSAFILGLALGALFIRHLADRGRETLSLLGWIQWFMGLAALATLPVYASTFEFMAFLVDALPVSDGGYALFGFARYGIAIAIMLPSTILAGMTLPLITATLLHTGEGERSIGRVYGANTLGSVLGVALAGLVALPLLGLKGIILAGALLDMGLGVLLLFKARRAGVPGRLRWAGAMALCGALLAGVWVQFGLGMDRRLLVSGVYRYGSIPDSSEPLLFYQDGRTATVGVHLGSPGDLAVLTTNGKPDASVSLRWIRAQSEVLAPRPIEFDDEATQTLLALIPLAHAPDAASVALIGHGSGLTGHSILGSPSIRRAVTIEIEPEMIAASEAFYPANARTFDDPRSTFVIDDAKAYFASRKERFDLIISEPSNPWVSGTSSLFTQEFYTQVQDYLAPGGLFAQWFHCYEMTDDLVSSVLAALHQAFPHFRGYQVGPGDLLIVASADGPLRAPDWGVFELPAIRRMLAHVPPFSPGHLDALHLFDQETLGAFLGDWLPRNSDFAPYLDLGAEKARFLKGTAEGYLGLGTSRVSLSSRVGRAPRDFAEEWTVPVLEVGPLHRLGVGAWLRWARFQEVSERDVPTPAHGHALEAYRSLSLQFNLGSSPPQWRSFIGLVEAVEASLHGGTSGVVDTLFYGRLFRYLREQEAPLEARAAADFLFGVASWDDGRTVAALEILLGAHEAGEGWISPRTLLEGGALAQAALGDADGAQETLDTLTPSLAEAAPDLDVRLEVIRALLRQGATDPVP